MLVSQCRSFWLMRASSRCIIGRCPSPTLRLYWEGGVADFAFGIPTVFSCGWRFQLRDINRPRRSAFAWKAASGLWVTRHYSSSDATMRCSGSFANPAKSLNPSRPTVLAKPAHTTRTLRPGRRFRVRFGYGFSAFRGPTAPDWRPCGKILPVFRSRVLPAQSLLKWRSETDQRPSSSVETSWPDAQPKP